MFLKANLKEQKLRILWLSQRYVDVDIDGLINPHLIICHV